MAASLGDPELPLLNLNDHRPGMGVPGRVETVVKLALDYPESDDICIGDDRRGRVTNSRAKDEGRKDNADERDPLCGSKRLHESPPSGRAVCADGHSASSISNVKNQ